MLSYCKFLLKVIRIGHYAIVTQGRLTQRSFLQYDHYLGWGCSYIQNSFVRASLCACFMNRQFISLYEQNSILNQFALKMN
jgi:hypothetical protein